MRIVTADFDTGRVNLTLTAERPGALVIFDTWDPGSAGLLVLSGPES